MPVVQQPTGSYGYVAKDNVTQFSLSKNLALLAHSNSEFYTLDVGESFRVGFEKGLRTYEVIEVTYYQRIGHRFISLRDKVEYTEREIFERYYRGSGFITLQTCFTRYGNRYWGVVFIRAVPLRTGVYYKFE